MTSNKDNENYLQSMKEDIAAENRETRKKKKADEG